MAVKLELKKDDVTILEQDLAPGNYVIGADLSCDIMLPDLDEPVIAVVQSNAEKGKFSATLISQIDGLIANNENLTASQSLENQKQIQFSYASYYFTVKASGKTSTQNKNDEPTKQRSAMSKIMLLLALVFALAAVGTQILFAIIPKEKPITNPTPRIITEEEKAQNLLSYLHRRLASADLVEKVKLTNNGQKIEAIGRLSEIEFLRWREIATTLTPLDKNFLKNDVDIEPFGEDIISGYGWIPQPYVITKKGDRFKEGDILPTGWTIELISRKSVKVRKDDISYEIGLP